MFPMGTALFTNLAQYVLLTEKIRPMVWVSSYLGIYYGGTFLAGVVYFLNCEDSFVFKYFCLGAFASLVSFCGIYFATKAIGTGAALGPIQAILSS